MRKRVLFGDDPDRPLIVFVGRSNVGKSSIIRSLTGTKVRVGKKPGSTRQEIFIDLGPYLLMDMAGFGHMAGQSKKFIEEMKTRIVRRLEEWSRLIKLSVLIVDISLFRVLCERWEARGEIPIDVEFYGFISEISPKAVVAANKIDKLKKKQVTSELEFMRQKLIESFPKEQPVIVPISAKKGHGVEQLRRTIEEMLERDGMAPPEW